MNAKTFNKPIKGKVKDVVIKNWQFEGTLLEAFSVYMDEYGAKHGKGAPRLFYPEDKDYYVKVRQTATQIIAELIPLQDV